MSLSMPTTSMPWLARKLAVDAPIKPALPVTIAMDIYELQNSSYFQTYKTVKYHFQPRLSAFPKAWTIARLGLVRHAGLASWDALHRPRPLSDRQPGGRCVQTRLVSRSLWANGNS